MTRAPGDDAFDVRTERRADHLRLLVSGELDLFREADLLRALDEVLADTTPERLVLDVRGVLFLDSSGLRALLMCRDRARSVGVPLVLAVAPGPVTRLLDVAGVRNWFAYDDSVIA
jgi:anti-sigma B factor antagonist